MHVIHRVPLLAARVFVAAGLLIGSVTALAGPEVVIEREEVGSRFFVYLENRSDFRATVSLDLSRVRNASPSTNPPPFVLEPWDEVEALMLEADRGEEPVFDVRYRYRWGDMDARHRDHTYLVPIEVGEDVLVGQGYHGSFTHKGRHAYAIDFIVPEGTPVRAARGGIVLATESSHDRGGRSADNRQYNNYIWIYHSDHTLGKYSHLQRNGVAVFEGDQVEAGELIGYSGNTGMSTRPHLHFGVLRPIDGAKFQSVKVKYEMPGKGIFIPETNDRFVVVD